MTGTSGRPAFGPYTPGPAQPGAANGLGEELAALERAAETAGLSVTLRMQVTLTRRSDGQTAGHIQLEAETGQNAVVRANRCVDRPLYSATSDEGIKAQTRTIKDAASLSDAARQISAAALPPDLSGRNDVIDVRGAPYHLRFRLSDDAVFVTEYDSAKDRAHRKRVNLRPLPAFLLLAWQQRDDGSYYITRRKFESFEPGNWRSFVRDDAKIVRRCRTEEEAVAAVIKSHCKPRNGASAHEKAATARLKAGALARLKRDGLLPIVPFHGEYEGGGRGA